VSAAADALSLGRLAAAVVLPHALTTAIAGGTPRWVPAGLFVFAAASDFLDGRLARGAGPVTRHGAVLDNLADVTFVLAASVTGVFVGLVPRVLPIAIVAAFGGYVLASVEQRTRARSRVGHAGGVLNYAVAGLITAAVLAPGVTTRVLVGATADVAAAVNLLAVLERFLPSAPRRAPVPPAAGTRARSPHSSA